MLVLTTFWMAGWGIIVALPARLIIVDAPLAAATVDDVLLFAVTIGDDLRI